MSTAADPEGRPTVLDLVPPALRKALVPVGRLDFITEGLILLTDDGELAQRVAHPRYGCGKTYEAKVRGEPAAAALDKLRGGIVLEGRRTAPARITRRRVPGPAGRRARRRGRRQQLVDGGAVRGAHPPDPRDVHPHRPPGDEAAPGGDRPARRPPAAARRRCAS